MMVPPGLVWYEFWRPGTILRESALVGGWPELFEELSPSELEVIESEGCEEGG